jgi:hypothetical protein
MRREQSRRLAAGDRVGTTRQPGIPSATLHKVAFLAAWLLAAGWADGQAPRWVPIGPRPITGGQVEEINDKEVAGAIKAIALHPTNSDVVYVGAVNGGIWKTANAGAARPDWTPQSDAQTSGSIGALEFDPTDPSNQTLVAGVGIFSSIGSGGQRTGILRTADGGTHWTPIDGGGVLKGLNISGVAPRGAVIVISANTADRPGNAGIWRSSDTGAAWTQISGGAGTGLPAGPSYDFAADPANPRVLYTNGGAIGLYRSADAGATWAKVSNGDMDTPIASASNIKIAVGRSNNVFVAIVDRQAGQVSGVFRSGDGGMSWIHMDLPVNADGTINPGRQGQIHLSIAADPLNAQVAYIGGDRQDDPNMMFPNSIGANDFSGNLMRGDASQPAGSQWVHLTHSNTMGPAGGGTASGSAPHADSRDLAVAVDPNGVDVILLDGCDGGIYRRTKAQNNQGDWFSINGSLQVTELHAIAYDSNADLVIGGAQDTGTPQQQTGANVRWQSVSTGDGGVVAVDTASSPGLSIRYSSADNLRGFRRQVYNSANFFQIADTPSLVVLEDGDNLVPQFYTPIKLNGVNPSRLIIGAANAIYESSDQGDTIAEIGPGIAVNSDVGSAIAYGASDNADVLYAGAGNQVYVRTGASPATPTPSATYRGGRVVAIAVDPANSQTAYVADSIKVYRTTDAGGTWTEITGNLATLKPGKVRALAYSTNNAEGAIVVGTDTGAFIAPGAGFSTWNRLGADLPSTPVFHLEYNTVDRIFVAGTLGRGAWILRP